MTNEDIENIRSKAQSCNLSIDLSPEASDINHTLEEPTSLNTLSLLPELFETGVTSVKIEGRQRSPFLLNKSPKSGEPRLMPTRKIRPQYQVSTEWDKQLAAVSEGSQTTLGAYHRKWQ